MSDEEQKNAEHKAAMQALKAERDAMMARTGRRTVPQIYIGDTHVGGFDDLSALERAGKLDVLLAD